MDQSNPFNITKAVDFSDQQILDFWVDYSEGISFSSILKPTSPMPMYVLGGKGSGKTHLLRYFSFACQQLRHSGEGSSSNGVSDDGYLGVYLRCSGVNASRFSGKGRSGELWSDVFAYYFELWLSQLLLDNLERSGEASEADQVKICCETVKLIDEAPSGIESMADLKQYLRKNQQEIDLEINNVALTGSFNPKIRITRGRLIFGLPKIIKSILPSMGDCLIVYLIDEFENLSEDQQMYVNTLVREKEEGCTFKIGARLYGIKTNTTFSDDEENKEGSEFERLHVDEVLRQNEAQYKNFAVSLILRRLSDYDGDRRTYGPRNHAELQCLFSTTSVDNWSSIIVESYRNRERPWVKELRTKLKSVCVSNSTYLNICESDIDDIVACLMQRDHPIIEKMNIFLFYREWSRKSNLKDAALQIKVEARKYLEKPSSKTRYGNAVNQFKLDMVAQMLRSSGNPQRYTGLDTLIDISWGLPRNLLILLKNITSWSEFRGESPLSGGVVSESAQSLGVADSAEWFFEDARSFGSNGRQIQTAVSRVATFLRMIRFSDKPSECSPSSFSCDLSQMSDHALSVVRGAERWSLLISVGQRKQKNSERITHQFQVNRMLAPKWDLPIARRGVPELNVHEAEAIFGTFDTEEMFNQVLDNRRRRMTAPSFIELSNDGQKELF